MDIRLALIALQEVQLGELRPDELLVKMRAVGVCHTDIVVRDQWYPVPLPAVLGHEGGGIVEQVGSAVSGFDVGDHVSLSFNSCGICRQCLTGRPSYCVDFFGRNFGSSRPHTSEARRPEVVSLEVTASPKVLRQALECLAPAGVCGLIGGAAFGTEVTLDMNSILIPGRTVRGLVEGDSIPQLFIPRLVELWRQGKFPVDRIVSTYDFDATDQAVHDAEGGKAIKPVLVMS